MSLAKTKKDALSRTSLKYTLDIFHLTLESPRWNVYGAVDTKKTFSDLNRFLRWRVSLMERGVALLDFETIDQMVQVHDYAGVSMSSRDADSKKAATEASKLFSDHYPELLVRSTSFAFYLGFLTYRNSLASSL